MFETMPQCLPFFSSHTIRLSEGQTRSQPKGYQIHSRQANLRSGSTINPDETRLGYILMSKGLISQTQLDQTLMTQRSCNQPLGKLLVDQFFITAEQLEAALNEQTWRRNGYWAVF